MEKTSRKQRDIATARDITGDSASQCLSAARADGAAAPHSPMAHGHCPKLAIEQKQLISDFLRHGMKVYGLDLRELHNEFDLTLNRPRQNTYAVRLFFNEAEFQSTNFNNAELQFVFQR